MGIGVTFALGLAIAAQAVNANATEVTKPQTEAEAKCTADKNLCLLMTKTGEENTGTLMVKIKSGTGVSTAQIDIPSSLTDYDNVSFWPQIIPLGGQSALIGIIEHHSTMYSGGGGSSDQLHLFKIRYAGGVAQLGNSLSTLPMRASLFIRACFSEKEYIINGDACHDDYQYKATLTALQKSMSPDGWPTLKYTSIATTFPRTSRRSRDNSKDRHVRKADLITWKDPKCSYSRQLRYNAATQQYEMNQPAPECSDYTEI